MKFDNLVAKEYTKRVFIYHISIAGTEFVCFVFLPEFQHSNFSLFPGDFHWSYMMLFLMSIRIDKFDSLNALIIQCRRVT